MRFRIHKANATIPAGTVVFEQDSARAKRWAVNIRVYAKVILDDVEVTEFTYEGVNYTVDTNAVQWD